MSETGRKEFLLLTSKDIKERYLNKHCTKEVARLLLLEPVFDWKMITEIDLSFLNIIHIVGLRILTNVKHLTLARNKIKTIENLDACTKLEHLDLSYNRITKIANVEHLTELKCLNLAENKISEINNLDNNAQLVSFFIGRNDIADIDQIFYLKRFKDLEFLDVSNNAATAGEGARQQIIDRMPNLLYVDAIKVTDPERKSAVRKKSKDAGSAERVVNATADAAAPDEDAFLYDTDGKQFLSHLFKDDYDGKILSKWNTTVRSAFVRYKKKMNKQAIRAYDASLERYDNSVGA